MFKILVFASTENILKYKKNFSNSGFTFDYLVCKKDSEYNFGQIKKQKISINNLMLPLQNQTSPLSLTEAQDKEFGANLQELVQLKTIVLNSLVQTKKNDQVLKLNNPINSSDQILYLDQVIDLNINKVNKKIHLEINQYGVVEYDHIYIEDSYLALSSLEKSIQLNKFLTFNAKATFQFVGLKYKMSSLFFTRPFWLMADANYKSIYDNFYFFSVPKENKDMILEIWSWIPIQQVSNPAYLSYWQKRVQKKIQKKFTFLDLKIVPMNQFNVQPVNTLMKKKNKLPNLVSLIPGFHFLSESEVLNSISLTNQNFFKKNKIHKDNVTKDKHEDIL
jgi:hypothetical protein